MTKSTYFEIDVQTFRTGVLVFVNCDSRKIRAVYKRWRTPADSMLEIERLLKSWDAQLHGSPISAGLTYLTPEGPVVLLWLQGEDRFGHLEVVAHEMLHAAWRVMYHCAIGRNESTEEVLAYLTGSLVKRTVRAIKKFGKEVII